jgi:hypothetical protein
MSEKMNIVGYVWRLENTRDQIGEVTVVQQTRAIKEYASQQGVQIIAMQVEVQDKKHKNFPELEKAIELAKENNAKLVIAQLQNLTRYEAFAQLLIESGIPFYCIDQPRIDERTLPAVVDSIRAWRDKHSMLISEGLARTMAQLGNPHAKQEITKVNRPKTENAIFFALILGPIIAHYQMQGFSQRKMVDTLNEEGFTAPEGGNWVLSQLQKVLERIELNNAALDLCNTFDEVAGKGYDAVQVAKALTAMRARSPGHEPWDESLVNKVQDRLILIRDILDFNDFVIHIYPKVQQFQIDGLSDEEMAAKLNHEGIPVPSRVVWEIEQEALAQGEAPPVVGQTWQKHSVQLAKELSERRKDDMMNYIHADTLQRAKELFDKITKTGRA